MKRKPRELGQLWAFGYPRQKYWLDQYDDEEDNDDAHDDEDYGPRWIAYKIIEMTDGRVFIKDDDYYETIQSFYRSGLESRGFAFIGGRGQRRYFYTDAGKAAREAEMGASASEAVVETVALKSAEAKILGISGRRTRIEVMRAFRKQSKICHPDHGGTNELFGQLCKAKDEALSRLA